LVRGRENAKAYLKEHPEVAAQIEQEIKEAMGLDDSLMVVEQEEMKED